MTLFERIISGEIPGNVIYTDDRCVAIRDVNPQAPVHVAVNEPETSGPAATCSTR